MKFNKIDDTGVIEIEDKDLTIHGYVFLKNNRAILELDEWCDVNIEQVEEVLNYMKEMEKTNGKNNIQE